MTTAKRTAEVQRQPRVACNRPSLQHIKILRQSHQLLKQHNITLSAGTALQVAFARTTASASRDFEQTRLDL
jgi:hypothetical protein